MGYKCADEKGILCNEPPKEGELLSTMQTGSGRILLYAEESKPTIAPLISERIKNGLNIKILRQFQKDVYNAVKRKTIPNKAAPSISPRIRRLVTSKFNWKTCCFLCGEECIQNKYRADRNDWRMVEVLKMKQTIFNICNKYTR